MAEIPAPRFEMPVEIMTMVYWQCTRCGALVAEKRLELHSVNHTALDRFLETLTAILDKFEGKL